MAEKKVYRFLTIARAQKRAERAGSPVTVSALATVLARRSGRSSALPYPPTSTAILPCWLILATGRFFDVKMVGFSL
jgi:hypothetical protein